MTPLIVMTARDWLETKLLKLQKEYDSIAPEYHRIEAELARVKFALDYQATGDMAFLEYGSPDSALL